MNPKTTFIAALAAGISCLTTGCYVAGGYPDPYYDGVVVSGGGPAYDNYDFIMPLTIIVENGVRHDIHYYRKHPGAYYRDRDRYPHRFPARAHQRPIPPQHRPPGYRPPPPRVAPSPVAKPAKPKYERSSSKKKSASDKRGHEQEQYQRPSGRR